MEIKINIHRKKEKLKILTSLVLFELIKYSIIR